MWQGNTLFPYLFNIDSEMILRELKEIDGKYLGGHNENNLKYVDDNVSGSKWKKNIKHLKKREHSYTLYKMRQIPTCRIEIDDEQMKKKVNECKYLCYGYLTRSEGICTSEIQLNL